MRLKLLGLLLVLPVLFILFQVWLLPSLSFCADVLTYRLGEVDERFGITANEAREAAVEAAAVWEYDGQSLLRFSESGKILINFIYDERQARFDAASAARNSINQAERTTLDIRDSYDQALNSYETLQKEYEDKVVVYENRLATFNSRVEATNNRGGATDEELGSFRSEEEVLRRESRELNQIGRQLNQLVEELNTLAEQGNILVSDYNRNVQQYNQIFGESAEFTQGEYYEREIDIYSFGSKEELVTVLSHEFGHALGIRHVEGSDSIMYHMLGDQSYPLALTAADEEALLAICEPKTFSTWTASLGRLLQI